VLVGYFITSYPTRAHGIMVIYTSLPVIKMKTSSAIKVLDGKTRAVYKDEFLESD